MLNAALSSQHIIVLDTDNCSAYGSYCKMQILLKKNNPHPHKMKQDR